MSQFFCPLESFDYWILFQVGPVELDAHCHRVASVPVVGFLQAIELPVQLYRVPMAQPPEGYMAPTSQGVALVPLAAVVKREYPKGVLLLPTISPSVYMARVESVMVAPVRSS